MSKADEYIKKYVDAEVEINKKYGLSENAKFSGFLYLENQRSWQYMHDDLKYCRELRNFFVHRENIKGEYPAQPTDHAISFLDSVIDRIKNPPIAANIMIHTSEVTCAKMNTSVREIMKLMIKEKYTHIPIINDLGLVVGVFSENTLLDYMVNDIIVEIDSDVVFADLKQYLPFDAHKSETFAFVRRNTMLSDIQMMFNDALNRGVRIGMLFVTQNGSSKEKPLGIITAWDIAGRDQFFLG